MMIRTCLMVKRWCACLGCTYNWKLVANPLVYNLFSPFQSKASAHERLRTPLSLPFQLSAP